MGITISVHVDVRPLRSSPRRPAPNLPEVLPQVIQDSFRAVMGNFSGVIKILWVFVPLIFMGQWMAVKSEQA